MENQHKLIKGYRDLSQDEIDLMNDIKSAGELLQSIIDKVQKHIVNQSDQAYLDYNKAEIGRLDYADPYEWCTAAKTDLQTGLMKLTRAVAQPTTF